MDPDRNARRRLARIEQLLAAGSVAEALRRCRLEHRRSPERPETIALLARLLVANGKANEAIALLEKALAAGPGPVELMHDLGLACQAAGLFGESEKHFRAVLDAVPDYLPALVALGQLLEAQGRVDEAETHYRQHADADGDTGISMRLGLARALMETGRLAEARQCYYGLAEVSPAPPEALAGCARLLEIEGRSSEAHGLLEPLVSAGEASAEILMIYGRLLNQLGRPEQARDILTDALGRPDLNAELASRVHRHLAQSLDQLGEYSGAMQHLRLAHAGRGRFSEKDCVEQTQILIEHFSERPERRADPPATGSPFPAFIVGMPRAGSSLLEQALAAHSEVAAGGERAEFLNLADRWGGIGRADQQFPLRLHSLPERWSAEFAGQYREASRCTDETRCMTDKMPPNFLFLGLIESLLPDARIIDCRREPLDNGLSCYFQEFSGHWFDFCHDLESIAAYYRQYRRLMEHWRDTLALPVLEVHYEELVADFEPQVARILEFLGLPWQDACLRFFESDRPVRTASHAQIRKPVYQNSVGRHRPYLDWLTPISDAIDEDAPDS